MKTYWDEYRCAATRGSDEWAASDRGWLFVEIETALHSGMKVMYDRERKVWREESSLGNYLDYGADHYRSKHGSEGNGVCHCATCEPGNIHCVVYLNPDSSMRTVSRYVATIEQAREWIEAEAGKIRKESAR